MLVNKNSTVFSIIFPVLLVLSFTGCGGGGGGDASSIPPDELSSLPYTGVTSAAVIESADIEEFMLLTYFSNSHLYDFAKNTTLPHQMPIQSSVTGVQVLLSEPGPCGGIANYDLEVNGDTGEFHGSVIYDGFDDCEITISGTIQLSGRLDPESIQFSNLTMGFELLELTDNSLGVMVLSGKFIISQNFPTETINFDLRMRDQDTGKVYWLDSYRTTVLYGYDSQSFEEVAITGRYYDHDRGYVDVYTATPIRTYYEDDWPSSGVYIVEGAANASARLTFLSPVLYMVETDVNGDETYEYNTGRIHYPGANTLPVVDAGADIVGNVGCIVSLDGSNSSDADLDVLKFEWMLTSAPTGSVSQLLNASTPNPSFTPDVKGEYQFSLSIFDGFDTVVDYVDLTAYGDLFCLNDTTVTPYAQIGQYEADVAIGDVTSDGRADVLALTREAELYVFTQNLSGGLFDPVLYTVDNWRAVTVGDVTGDGKSDAVVTTDAGVGVLKQSDTGELMAMVEYLFDPPLASAAYTYSLALGDFDNNGGLDAAVLPDGGPVYVFLQNVDGTLGPPSTHETLTDGWSRVIAGDVTGDGLTDIVLSRADLYGFDNIGVLPQAQSGGFAATVYYTIGNLPYTHTDSVVLGDLNGDSRLDLAYELYEGIDESSTHIGVLPQSGTGTFNTPVIYNAYYPPIFDMAVDDVTGDGLDDLIVLHGTPHTGLPFSPTTVSVLAATGGGALAPYDNYPIHQTPQSWGGLAVGDVDGNGNNDVVVTAHVCDEAFNCGPSLVVLHGVK